MRKDAVDFAVRKLYVK